MVLFRLTGIFVLAPVLGSDTVPRIVKVFLAVGLSLCAYPMLLDAGRPSAPLVAATIENGLQLWGLIGRVGLELVIGFAIGYAASLPLVGMQVAGHLMSQQMGLAFASIVNPTFGDQSGLVDQMLFLMALTLFALLGGHHVMFAAVIGSFQHIPLGGFDQFGGLLDFILGLINIVFDMAIRIAAPLLCLIFLLTAAMGFIARTVPQMNILSVGFSVRILSAASFLVVFIASGSEVFLNTLEDVFRHMLQFFGG